MIPVTGWDTWLTVMERAGYRCQCRAPRCPHYRKNPEGRCGTEQSEATKLTAGPADPGPDPARTIAQVDTAELVAWCGPCWGRAVTEARRSVRATAEYDHETNTDTLF